MSELIPNMHPNLIAVYLGAGLVNEVDNETWRRWGSHRKAGPAQADFIRQVSLERVTSPIIGWDTSGNYPMPVLPMTEVAADNSKRPEHGFVWRTVVVDTGTGMVVGRSNEIGAYDNDLAVEHIQAELWNVLWRDVHAQAVADAEKAA